MSFTCSSKEFFKFIRELKYVHDLPCCTMKLLIGLVSSIRGKTKDVIKLEIWKLMAFETSSFWL